MVAIVPPNSVAIAPTTAIARRTMRTVEASLDMSQFRGNLGVGRTLRSTARGLLKRRAISAPELALEGTALQ